MKKYLLVLLAVVMMIPSMVSAAEHKVVPTFKLQKTTQTMEGIKLLEETEKLQNEYEEFHSDSRVHDFLAKELAFCRMMQNINYKITESIHFE